MNGYLIDFSQVIIFAGNYRSIGYNIYYEPHLCNNCYKIKIIAMQPYYGTQQYIAIVM